MTKREQTIAEIREALEKATPGKWIRSHHGFQVLAWDGKTSITLFEAVGQHEREQQIANAHLIANAPEWLRFLLTELSDAQEQNRKLIEGLRTGLMHAGTWSADDYVSLMRDVLKECGVAVDE